ncbi:hypothetical protein [Aurantiacibacter odishensis]|uniref:hypothetical protein n=1 Tax=Aurantiacibacter odishensis TaxID=1155476 RepID=UPI0013C405AB|nr:hypothetical protein [Aurantiacibacter odishensis]
MAQLDQQSRLSPGYALLVPDAFSGNAARERSKLALQLGQPEVALAEAREQIALRPMPAESLSLLALAAIETGNSDIAQEALGAASRRGWREPLAQYASGEAALNQGLEAVAAQRIAALFATGNLRKPAYTLLARLVETSEGREAFAERLAAFGRWQSQIVLGAADYATAENWSSTIAMALDQGAKLNCDQVHRLAERYRRANRLDAVARLQTGACRS